MPEPTPANDEGYTSPLAERNASPAMQRIFSSRYKFTTWRRLWLALAEAQQELGLGIEQSQLDELARHLDEVDYEAAGAYERRLRHDVMAHVHALGDQAPAARPIIHLGATSQFVNDNTELLQIRDALQLTAGKLAAAIDRLARFARQHAALPTLGFTHFQPAQPTTVGKRAAMWIQELTIALEEIEHRLASLKFRGAKGTTGTQASFLSLFRGAGFDEATAHEKVEQLDARVTEKMGWDGGARLTVSGQTYPRLVDGLVASSLSSVAAAAQKLATDIRLLASRKEIEEPFGQEQIGSSAMAYKRNPMRCERITGLSRFVIGMTQTPFTTAAEQWLERTLDDSSARRLTLPEPFLAVDGVLELLINVSDGLVVYEKTITANLQAELPFMATENLLMAAVEQGADRQEVHEIIRAHSQAAAQRVKEEGQPNDLLERLRQEPAFADIDLEAAMAPEQFVGRAPQQVEQLIQQVVTPIRSRYSDAIAHQAEVAV